MDGWEGKEAGKGNVKGGEGRGRKRKEGQGSEGRRRKGMGKEILDFYFKFTSFTSHLI